MPSRKEQSNSMKGGTGSTVYKRAGCETSDHRMILGTTNGLVSFNPWLSHEEKGDIDWSLLRRNEMILSASQNLTSSITH